MELRRLGKSGLKVSSLCLGAMTFGESETFMKGVTSDDAEARRMVDRALAAGLNFIDTANTYSEGRSEELLGEWLAARRKDVILATKCRFGVGVGRPKPMDQGLSRRHILTACEDSLRRLRTDWIDLYQVHMQDGAVEIDETLRALDDLVTSGKVRYAGCSNYAGYRMAEAAAVADRRNLHRFESVQLQWSLIERGAEREMIPAARAFGLGVMVWSPLCRGLLAGRYRRDMPPPAGSRLAEWKDTWTRINTERNWRIIDAVAEVAKDVGSTSARVSLAWLLQKPEVSSVIIGVRDSQQLDDNLAAVEVKLSPAQVERLDKVSQPEWGYPYDFIGARERW
jgi:aryl-alcohol dehydrogenase-like predicted oxidoreductase